MSTTADNVSTGLTWYCLTKFRTDKIKTNPKTKRTITGKIIILFIVKISNFCYFKFMSLITIGKGNAKAIISDLGAWLTLFNVGDKKILMLGYEYEQDGKTKRRGGLPILFPNAGKSIESENLKLSQHGFARDMKWQITYKSDNELVLSLKDTKETFDQFPFHFICNLTYLLNDNSLNVFLSVTNNSSIVMPIAPGFHPYFNLLQEKRDMFINPINDFKFDGTTKYVNSKSPLKFELPDVGKILLTYSDEFKNLSYWAQPDGNFICIEPWVGEEGAIINTSQVVNVKPMQTLEFDLNIICT